MVRETRKLFGIDWNKPISLGWVFFIFSLSLGFASTYTLYNLYEHAKKEATLNHDVAVGAATAAADMYAAGEYLFGELQKCQRETKGRSL